MQNLGTLPGGDFSIGFAINFLVFAISSLAGIFGRLNYCS
jgi:hypothetical protein